MVKIGLATPAVVAAYGGIDLGVYPGYEGPLKVEGKVNGYLAKSGNAYVTYELSGLEKACETTPEGVANACGIHIHEGKTCDDASAVGGHYFATESDPWGALGYNSKFGFARGSVKASIGDGEDISGRAIVVHDSTGGRVACALLPSEFAVQDEPTKNIVELAQSVDSLSTLVSAVVAGDLADTLSSPGPFTVFAPNNDAFGALPEGTLDTLLKPENKDQLVDVLTYHVVPSQVLSTDLKIYQQVETVEGKKLQVLAFPFGDKTVVRVGSKLEASVLAADNLATNGVAHIIDSVMLPPSHLTTKSIGGIELGKYPGYEGPLNVEGKVNGYLAKSGNAYVTYELSGLEDACETTPEGVANACGIHIHEGKTCDDASAVGGHYFATESDPWGALGYNSKFGFARGSVKAAIGDGEDISGRAIVVHDSTGGRVACALLPSKFALQDEPTKNIVELAQSVDSLSTLVSAVVAGDLADTLSSPGPFTVFAPNNDAFGALPEGTLDTLLKPENKDQLVDILTYHVVPAQVLSTDLKIYQQVETVEGKKLQVLAFPLGDKTVVRVGSMLEASVLAADNLATNGVAHIIDSVMLPPSHSTSVESTKSDEPTMNIVELAQSVDSLSTLVSAVVAGDLADTLSSPGPFTVFAPNNGAFAALPEGTLDTLLKPENKDQLVDILTYHVVPAQVLSTDLEAYQQVDTVEGKKLQVLAVPLAGDAKLVKVGASLEATVIAADNLATNGVAHIIDLVMLPPSQVMV